MVYTYVVNYRPFEGLISMTRKPDGGLNINNLGPYSTFDTQFLLIESEKQLNVLEVVNDFAQKHQGEHIPSLDALIPKLEADYDVKVRVPSGEVRVTSLNGKIV